MAAPLRQPTFGQLTDGIQDRCLDEGPELSIRTKPVPINGLGEGFDDSASPYQGSEFVGSDFAGANSFADDGSGSGSGSGSSESTTAT